MKNFHMKLENLIFDKYLLHFEQAADFQVFSFCFINRIYYLGLKTEWCLIHLNLTF